MLIETSNLVSTDDFRKDFDKYVTAAKQGSGPIALTQDAEVVGFFVSTDEYEALFGAAVKKLLAGREKGPTLSQEEARVHIQEIIRRATRKS